MTHPRFALFLFAGLLAALVGCSPTLTSPGPVNTYIDSTYSGNISTLYGYGSKVRTDSTGLRVASEVKWRDSVGVLHSLSELKGRVVVLNFWATWCEFCTYEMPDLQATADSMAKKGVVVLGISSDAGDAIFSNVQGYVNYMKLRYQMVIDPKSTVMNNYGVWGTWPYTFIIDKTGHIAVEMPGKQTEKKFIDAINRAL